MTRPISATSSLYMLRFSVGLESLTNLDLGYIPEGLRQTFENNVITRPQKSDETSQATPKTNAV